MSNARKGKIKRDSVKCVIEIEVKAEGRQGRKYYRQCTKHKRKLFFIVRPQIYMCVKIICD